MHLLPVSSLLFFFFFFQAEDGIRDVAVTGVQTCALPISRTRGRRAPRTRSRISRNSWAAASPPRRPRRASAWRRSTRSPTNLTETTGASNARCPFTRHRRGGPGHGRRVPRWREWTQGHVALPPAGGGGLPLRPRSAECDADRRRTDERHARADLQDAHVLHAAGEGPRAGRGGRDGDVRLHVDRGPGDGSGRHGAGA